MASIVKIKRSSVLGKRPTTSDLQTGELALNTRDGKLFSSDGSNIFEIGSNTSFVATGTLTLGNTNPYTFPTSDGNANQVLTTDGAGNLSFANAQQTSSQILDSLGYTNSTITPDNLFQNDTTDYGDLTTAVQDAFGVYLNGEVMDFMEPIAELKEKDFGVLT